MTVRQLSVGTYDLFLLIFAISNLKSCKGN